MDEIRILAGNGNCGSGFLEESFERALSWKPHFIGCDAGSSDPGAAYLGTGKAVFPREAVKRDLRLMLLGARRLKIPLLLGSCGTAGGNLNLEWKYGILREIAEEENLSFNLALIRAEQDKPYLKRRLREGRIKPLDPAPPYDEATIERSEHIVGMMGAEPYQQALKNGAEVILAGRSCDTAIFAAIPLMHGFPEGLAWHTGKILECGAAAVVNRTRTDSMFAWVRKDHFVIEPPNPDFRCTPQSVASHGLYENGDPFHIVECSGTLDIEHARFEALNERSVKVTHSGFIHAPRYTVKLEGAEKVGYQTVVPGSVRDPFIIRQIDDWTEKLTAVIHERVRQVYGTRLKPEDYHFVIRIYGKNGTMGPLEPVQEIKSHELFLLMEITAPTQEIATTIAAMSRHQALHFPIPEWSGLITGLACPYTPAHLERGAIYRFNVNHVVEPDDPLEMFPIEYLRLQNGKPQKMAA
jgi:hypothetical protein